MNGLAARTITFAPVPCPADEDPSFWLASTPTTAAHYHEFLVDTDRDGTPDARLHGFPPAGRAAVSVDADGHVVLDPERAEHPVAFVSFHGARAFCDWLGGRLGVPCRLPTAGEWRRAAEGPQRWPWALGQSFDRDRYVTNAGGPAPVAQGEPNPYGLFDLTGQVFEWTADVGACAEADVPSRVVKGGSFILRNPENFQSAVDFTVDELSCLDCVGFRVLADSDPGGRP